MSAEPLAPWYFRARASILGALYGVAFFIGFPLAQLFGFALQPLVRAAPFAVSALALVLAGYAIRVWASSYLAASIVWTQDVRLGQLAIDGPYRSVRNPLYVGNILQAFGIGMLGPWPVTVLAGGLNLAYCAILVRVEERFLADKNGPAYAEYLARVPRFVPLPGKSAPPAGARGSLGEGMRSEAIVGLVTLAIVAFVIVSFLGARNS